MNNKKIYLDNAATSKLDPETRKGMLLCQDLEMMNASSPHKLGVKAAKAIEKARTIIAQKTNAYPKEIIFTSGGTESNNLAIKGIAFANIKKGNHIITSKIEHPSVLEATKWLKKHGFEITYLPVDKEGFVDSIYLERAIKKETILVSVIHGNNEIGTIEPIYEIGSICRKRGVYFHIDACQSFTKTDLDVKKYNLDLVTLNAHKIHGPKGVGALYIREGVRFDPLLHGGGQERGFRSGTYNTEGIVGFGRAVEIADEGDIKQMAKLRDYFIQKVQDSVMGVTLNGPRDNRLCNNINLRFNSVSGQKLTRELSERNIFVSAGSACLSTKLIPSHVLLAIGLKPELAEGGVRFSLSKFTTIKELNLVVENIIEIVQKERGVSCPE
ncbi:MAG: cysteine desulfurase [Candidatus Thermoplasmatota archaeon]|nr:cysteine desulfurase [Candidatus Thermoplasmatota archaeon]